MAGTMGFICYFCRVITKVDLKSMASILSQKNKTAWAYIGCAVVVLLATALRSLFAGKADIGNDECFSLYYAIGSFSDYAAALSTNDNPPLWEFILHFWVKAFGISALSIRILSVTFSSLAVVPIWLTGERFVGRHAGLVASLLYSFSTFSIFLAHDGRVYSLLCLLSAWSLYLFLVAFNDTEQKYGVWIGLTIVNVLIMYSHYMAFWVIVVEALVILIAPGALKRLWKPALAHIAALVVCYLPMWPVLYCRLLDSGIHGTWISKSKSISALYFMFCHLTNAPVPAVLFLGLAFGALVVTLVNIIRKRYTWSNTTVLTLAWVVPLLVSFAVSFFLGMFLNRYFYFILPAYLLALTAYSRTLSGNKVWLRYTLDIAMILLMVVSCQPDSTKLRHAGWKGDVSATAQRLLELEQETTCNIVIAPDWLDKQLVYYFDAAHSAFVCEGRFEEPVFEPYLTSRGYIYYSHLRLPDRPVVHIVRSASYPVDEWISMLEDNGYTLFSTENFLQQEIITFKRTEIEHQPTEW